MGRNLSFLASSLSYNHFSVGQHIRSDDLYLGGLVGKPFKK